MLVVCIFFILSLIILVLLLYSLLVSLLCVKNLLENQEVLDCMILIVVKNLDSLIIVISLDSCRLVGPVYVMSPYDYRTMPFFSRILIISLIFLYIFI